LVLYIDGDIQGSWQKVYQDSKNGSITCKELVAEHRTHGLTVVKSGQPGILPTTQKGHPYYWFVVAADCDRPEGLDLRDFRLEFDNPAPLNSSGKWYVQFSFDHQGLGQAYIFFFVFYASLLIAHVYGVLALVKSGAYHTLVRLITLGVSFLFLSCMSFMIHYCVFSDNGVGSPGIEGVGLALTMMAQLMFMFLCILISKGWTITTNHLGQALAVKATMLAMCVLYLALFIWDYVGRDPASTIYFYDSAVGYIIIVVRVGIMVWFCWSIVETYKIEEDSQKKRFYLIFGSLAVTWFLMLPFFVLVALGLDDWVRYKAVTGICLVIDAFAFVTMVALFWPTRIETFFTVRPTPLQATMLHKNADTAQGNYETL